MEFLSFINVMATMLGLFLLEMVVLGVRGWKTSRQTPVSHRIAKGTYSDVSFCKIFWVTGMIYLFVIPLLSIILGLSVLSVLCGFPFENGGGLPSAGTFINILLLIFAVACLYFYCSEGGHFSKVTDYTPSSVSEACDTVVFKPMNKVRVAVVDIYGIIKGKFCPTITSED